MPPILRQHSSAAIALILGALLAGCGVNSPQTIVAHKVADALPHMIGPAAHYEVQVSGDTLALTRGRARSVRIVGQDVALEPAIIVDTLVVDAQDISFDPQTKRLQKIDSAQIMGIMNQQHLAQYLKQVKTLPNLTVLLRQSDIEAQAPVSLAELHTTVRLRGTLAPNAAEADKIDFIASGAQVGPVPVPAGLVNLALREINPLLDLSHIKVPVTVQSVEVVNGQLILRGAAQIKEIDQNGE